MKHTRALAALCSATLLVPAATAAAKPGHASGKGETKPAAAQAAPKVKAQAPAKAKAPKKAKTVTFVLKGVYLGDSTVKVAKGNGHVKKYKLAGKTLTLDFTAAKLVVADADANGVTLDDVKAGDKVLVQVRVPRTFTPGAPLIVRKLVDQTRPPVEETEDDETVEPAPEAPVAPAPEAPAPETPEVTP
jgi:hypothetical protein